MGIKIGQARLPAEYQEVEYIESSGTQWIDTGVGPTSNTVSQIKVMFLAWTGDCVYGYCWNDNTANYRLFNSYAYSDGTTFDNGRLVFDTTHNNSYARINTGVGYLSLNTVYEFEMGDFYVKDLGTETNIISGTAGTVTNTGNYTITLNNYKNTRYSQNRWYYVKIYESGILIRDMIPCYRIADGEVGMYDLVNDVFYTNSGSGTFTKGADISMAIDITNIKIASGYTTRLPSAYQEVEYIASSGTQYINTGWQPSSNYCKVVMDGTIYSGNSSWSVFFGMTNGSNAYSLHTNHSTWYFNLGSSININTGISFASGTDGIFTFEANNGSISVDITGSTYTGSYSGSVAQSTRPMYIFAFDENGSTTWKTNMKVREFKIYSDSSTLERDFVPCYRIADSVIGMYDLVNDQFYTNSGSGTFTKGNDISAYKDITKVYLGSTQVRPAGGIYEYDFTQSDYGFSGVWNNDNANVSYGQNSDGLFCSTSYSGYIGVEVFSMPNEVYTLDIKKIEISFNCSSSGSGGGICSTSGDSGDWIRVWSTGSQGLQKSISGSTSSLTNVPTPSGGYTLTIDFENGSAYTDTSNDVLTLTSTEVNTLKQEINNGTIGLVIMKNGGPSIAYITNAKFYY